MKTLATLCTFVIFLVGCAVDTEQTATRYSCVVTYECAGDIDARALNAVPCAVDAEDAKDRATEVGMAEADTRCGGQWTYVRSLCETQEPAVLCEAE